MLDDRYMYSLKNVFQLILKVSSLSIIRLDRGFYGSGPIMPTLRNLTMHVDRRSIQIYIQSESCSSKDFKAE